MADEHEREQLSPATVDFKAVAKVSSAATLQHVRLLTCTAEREPRIEIFGEDWAESAYIGFRSGATSVQDDRRFGVVAGFVCVYKPGWENGAEMPELTEEDPPALYIEVAFELEYQLADSAEVDERDLEHFAYVNGTHNAWPYWRELAQSATVRMGIPPLVVGPFKVPSTFDPQ